MRRAPLGRPLLAEHHVAAHVERAVGEVDVLPAQPRHLPRAHAGVAAEQDQDWLGTRTAEITYPAVRGAVHGIGLAIVGLSARDEGLRAVSTFAVILFGQQIEAHLRTIGWFAGLSEAELYELVLRNLTHRP
jgi:hypothetical protein